MADSRSARPHLSLGDVPALDGLRAVSVLLVILLHFDWLGCGWIGVQFFFVLSGFLISANLFLSQPQLPPRRLLITFYQKRFLRIFPLYYLALALCYAFEHSPLFAMIFQTSAAAKPWGYPIHALFLQNFSDTLFHSQADLRLLAHFWSLAVEEQFYLVFPFLLTLLSFRQLRGLAWAALLLAPAFRAWEGNGSVYKNTFAQIDAFAFGILLSAAWTRSETFRERCERHRKRILALICVYGATCLAIGLATLSVYHRTHTPVANTTLGFEPGSTLLHCEIWQFSLLDGLGALLVLGCLLWSHNRVLAHPALRYIGRISFGLYVYHYPIAFALEENFHFRFKSGRGALLFLAYFGATLAIASLSYFCWEKRFLELKRRLLAT